MIGTGVRVGVLVRVWVGVLVKESVIVGVAVWVRVLSPPSIVIIL
jgi:hypothetical protein